MWMEYEVIITETARVRTLTVDYDCNDNEH